MARRAALLLAMALAACTPAGTSSQAARATVVRPELPPALRFAGPPSPASPAPANPQLARDILALTFRLETGQTLETFTRFEGPVTVGVEAVGGQVPPTLDADLDDLLGRLRREAGIDIARARPGELASITISVLPRATLRREVAGVACFVIPGVSGWDDYRARRGSPETDWTMLRSRSRASVFLPADMGAQEVRDCLHEEVAQALGPLNDLYRLPRSVFDDANMHVVLTAWDMLVLRATYDPALRSGLSRAEVAALLPGLLARINPRGQRPDPGAVAESTPAWSRAIAAALDPETSDRARLHHAREAVARARAAGWADTRTALSLLALGRATLPYDTEAAQAAFLEAGTLYRARAGEGIETARVTLQLAAITLASGNAAAAAVQLDRAIPAARGAQDAALLSIMLLLRAEALALTARGAEAAVARSEGLAWGRYAWNDDELALRAAEVAALLPGA